MLSYAFQCTLDSTNCCHNIYERGCLCRAWRGPLLPLPSFMLHRGQVVFGPGKFIKFRLVGTATRPARVMI